MNNTLTFNEKRKFSERRSFHDRRTAREIRRATKGAESSQRATRKYVLMRDFFGSILAAVVGIIVLVSTGLFSAASSTGVQIILIVSIVCVYVLTFRRALYSWNVRL